MERSGTAALGDLEGERRAFERAHPEYGADHRLAQLRATEFARLDAQGVAYLDYTGAGLYPESLVRRHADWLVASVVGNPHSESEVSARATDAVERARAHVLRYFGASASEYDVVFTANATGALRLVGEAYPFGPGGRLVALADDHNSVNGLREYAAARGAQVRYVRLGPDLRVDADDLRHALDDGGPGAGPRLFALPAQSNFSGVQHDVGWLDYARERGYDVLLDAAAFVPTSRLDLGHVRADFVPVSFYKMAGYPTGVGCLIARREALGRLGRPWFAGGTVAFASVAAFAGPASAHRLFEGHQGFEDGTLNFLAIPAVDMALDFLDAVGVDAIHARVQALTAWTLERLLALRHANGRPVVEIYGPHDLTARGAVVLFNVVDRDGRLLDDRRVQADASAAGIAVRAGCHCNPGAREAALGLSGTQLRAYFAADMRRLGQEAFVAAAANAGAMQGAVRASFGLASDFADAYRLVRLLAGYTA
jgi:molybdenum cofactor sulfurtransferase